MVVWMVSKRSRYFRINLVLVRNVTYMIFRKWSLATNCVLIFVWPDTTSERCAQEVFILQKRPLTQILAILHEWLQSWLNFVLIIDSNHAHTFFPIDHTSSISLQNEFQNVQSVNDLHVYSLVVYVYNKSSRIGPFHRELLRDVQIAVGTVFQYSRLSSFSCWADGMCWAL